MRALVPPSPPSSLLDMPAHHRFSLYILVVLASPDIIFFDLSQVPDCRRHPGE